MKSLDVDSHAEISNTRGQHCILFQYVDMEY